jgi:hypothetical protein
LSAALADSTPTNAHTPGWAGWRYLFLVEGLPSVALGFVLLAFLPSDPLTAWWLKPAEREALHQAVREGELQEGALSRVGGAAGLECAAGEGVPAAFSGLNTAAHAAAGRARRPPNGPCQVHGAGNAESARTAPSLRHMWAMLVETVRIPLVWVLVTAGFLWGESGGRGRGLGGGEVGAGRGAVRPCAPARAGTQLLRRA